jgi:hypothetical protein
MENKTYTIDNTKFILKTDLTLDEGEEVQELLSGLFTQDNTIKGTFTGKQMKRFLELVLEPAEGNLPDNFNFGKTKESVQMEVFKDFFLSRVTKGMRITKDFAELIADQQKPSKS